MHWRNLAVIALMAGLGATSCARAYTINTKIRETPVSYTSVGPAKMVVPRDLADQAAAEEGPDASLSATADDMQCMQPFDVRIEESYRVEKRKDTVFFDVLYGSAFTLGAVPLVYADSAMYESSARPFPISLVSLLVGLAYFGNAVSVATASTGTTTESTFRTERKWLHSAECPGSDRPSIIAETRPSSTATHAPEGTETPTAIRAHSDDPADCYSRARCLDASGCLRDETCDSAQHRCLSLRCVRPFIEAEAISLARTVRSTAEVIALVQKPA